MKQCSFILLIALMLCSSAMEAMQALTAKQKQVAKDQLTTQEQAAATGKGGAESDMEKQIAADIDKWEQEAKEHPLYKAYDEASRWEYILSEKVEQKLKDLDSQIYQEQVKAKNASPTNDWQPDEAVPQVVRLKNECTLYSRLICARIPAGVDLDRDILVRTAFDKVEHFAPAEAKKVRERTAWTDDSVRKQIAAEFEAWKKNKNMPEAQWIYLANEASNKINSIHGPRMFTGFSDKAKIMIRTYAQMALDFHKANAIKNPYLLDYFRRWAAI